MTAFPDFEPAASRLHALLPVAATQLDQPTPCERYAVRDLLAHVVGLTAAFRASAEKEFGPLTDSSPAGVLPALEDNWQEQIEAQLPAMVAAWRIPSAWDGMTRAGGVDLPAQVMGVVGLDEITLHGWDLARATGQEYDCDDATAEACLTFVTQASGQDGGPFGPPVTVPQDAPVFDRVLGLSGRDPGWQRPGQTAG